MKLSKKVIISLGGSIIVPDDLDVSFLKSFKNIIEEFVEKGNKFVIYCGGGSIARKYQKALSEVIGNDQEAMDWTGISATHLNAFLVKTLFQDKAEDIVIEDPTQKIDFNKSILVAGGWKPGWSTDYDAVLVAKNLGADTIINMSNIDYVYDSDPKKNKGAKHLKQISWPNFRKLVGNKWSPGLNMPFDPIAAKEAAENNLKVIIIGSDLDNLRNILEGKEFKGTTIN